MKLFKNEPDAANRGNLDAPSPPPPFTSKPDTMQQNPDHRLDMGMGQSLENPAPKSRLGRAKRALQETTPEPKSAEPSWAGFQSVDPTEFVGPDESVDTADQIILPNAPFTPSITAPFTPSFTASITASFTPSFTQGQADPAPEFALDEPSGPLLSPSAPSLDLPTLPPFVPLTSVDHDAGAPDFEVLSAPTKDVSLDELRAILTGAPDRFASIEHATWDPAAAAAKIATPNLETAEGFRLAASEHLSGAGEPGVVAMESESALDSPTYSNADVAARPLPDLSEFDRVTAAARAPATKGRIRSRKGRLASVFAKQEVPDAPLTQSLSARSTKVLRIGAGALLVLGLALVGFLQFRGEAPSPTIPSVTVENTVASVTTSPGQPLDIPIAGQTTKPAATSPDAVEDDFFSEGEDFSSSEGEDFTVK